MNLQLPKKIFVTGTGTSVGKTVISSVLMAGLKAKYWKPIQSGLEEITDTQWIQKNTCLPSSHFLPETYRLQRPLSPHASAELEGVEINMKDFQLPEVKPDESLIVEGAGGLMVPLNDQFLMLDLIKKLGVPVLLVSSNVLGTINHTILSLEQLTRSGIEVIGVVLNGKSNSINREAIEKYGKTTVLAEVPFLEKINPSILKDLFDEKFLR